MECPKCHSAMEEHTLGTLASKVTVDKCAKCSGIWFDLGEAEQLKGKWMSDYIDDGDPVVGRRHNRMRDINCPRCNKQMEAIGDPVQVHIQYEACAEHGMYFDAGEFKDYKYETLMDNFRDFIFRVTRQED